jgi:hypothetical protein
MLFSLVMTTTPSLLFPCAAFDLHVKEYLPDGSYLPQFCRSTAASWRFQFGGHLVALALTVSPEKSEARGKVTNFRCDCEHRKTGRSRLRCAWATCSSMCVPLERTGILALATFLSATSAGALGLMLYSGYTLHK